MTLQEFIQKYQGKEKGYPSDNDFKGECLSIVKRYIKECFNINPPASGSNSAYGYWTNFPNPLPETFQKVAYSPGAIPKVGDIPIWNTKVGNGFGHIDVFVSGDSNSFVGFDQNWGGKQAHLQTHDYSNVVGWLTPKVVIIEPPIMDYQWLEQMFIERGIDIKQGESQARGKIQDIFDKAKKHDDETPALKAQIISTNEALADRAREVSVLTEQNQRLSDERDEAKELLNTTRSERDKADWEAKQATIKVTTLGEEIEKLSNEINKLKETNPLMGYSWLERFISLFKK